MSESDCDTMAALHAACFTVPRPWSATEFSSLLASPHVFALTRPEGFLLARAVAGEAEILTLAVDPRFRRLGLGRDFVQQFLARARQMGAVSAFLDVAADNGAALALYENCGFRTGHRRRAYYRAADGSPIDAVLMSCPLSSQIPKI